jgi:hypothetical protein
LDGAEYEVQGVMDDRPYPTVKLETFVPIL